MQSVHDYETEMVQYGFEVVRQSLKAAELAVSDRIVTNIMMKSFFGWLIDCHILK
ncbi:hypothetical protein [Oceanobacillus sp. CFH 90083]|uniref:hypothetical protein n=1 Tax=Oceanobacillus sp. CFH 90083 TaxID=2592336 RepID=UPI001883F53A|nr:hypothetical protein [Oceanobacillus sp. CFH 90083]